MQGGGKMREALVASRHEDGRVGGAHQGAARHEPRRHPLSGRQSG